MNGIDLESPAWLVTAVLFILLVFRDAARDALLRLTNKFVAAIYERFAGIAIFRRRSLSRYRNAVNARLSRISIPFLNNTAVTVNDIYVPLVATTQGISSDSGDAYHLVGQAKHAVVVGVPGSGKSMLLRHAMLRWTRRLQTPNSADVPVLCELHRHNDDSLSIFQHIVDQFRRDGFPRAEKFVRRLLHSGNLVLLLDGLDEVNTAHRDRVAQAIIDFATEHRNIKLVVTCRTAVYNGQLSPAIEHTLRIAEFDERLVRKFLRQWPGMKQTGRVEGLMEALRDSPRIMHLARNPLLLTMIAYLYGDESEAVGRQLPHSRAEFYQEATDVLLRRLKDSINRYPAPVKKHILQKIALRGLSSSINTGDRLTLPFAEIVVTINESLEELNLLPSDSGSLLTEIVERSGLLLPVDGGDRYQFTHLTLQEFFAARELLSKPDELVDKYRSDPARWRECIKLWCGIADQDCASVVRRIYEIDSLLGFECLGEARIINNTDADIIVRAMESELMSPTIDQAGLAVAFGLVASDPRPRGVRVFDFLATTAKADLCEERLAVRALAATNLPKAADFLMTMSEDDEVVRAALVSMGDIAVPHLRATANQGADWAIDGLRRIATPLAIEQLVELLEVNDINIRCAWHLAALIRYPDVERALRDTPVNFAEEGAWRWIWDPYRDTAGGSVPTIVSKIVQLIMSDSGLDRMPRLREEFDFRVAIPLCTVLLNELSQVSRTVSITRDQKARWLTQRELAGLGFRGSTDDPEVRYQRIELADLVKNHTNPNLAELDKFLEGHLSLPSNISAVLFRIDREVRFGILRLMAGLPRRSLRRRYWQDVLKPFPIVTFRTTWQYRAIVGLWFFTYLVGAGWTISTVSRDSYNYAMVTGYVDLLFAVGKVAGLVIIPLFAIIAASFRKHSSPEDRGSPFVIAMSSSAPFLGYMFFRALEAIVQVGAALLVLVALVTTIVILVRQGTQHDESVEESLKELVSSAAAGEPAAAWPITP